MYKNPTKYAEYGKFHNKRQSTIYVFITYHDRISHQLIKILWQVSEGKAKLVIVCDFMLLCAE